MLEVIDESLLVLQLTERGEMVRGELSPRSQSMCEESTDVYRILNPSRDYLVVEILGVVIEEEDREVESIRIDDPHSSESDGFESLREEMLTIDFLGCPACYPDSADLYRILDLYGVEDSILPVLQELLIEPCEVAEICSRRCLHLQESREFLSELRVFEAQYSLRQDVLRGIARETKALEQLPESVPCC